MQKLRREDCIAYGQATQRPSRHFSNWMFHMIVALPLFALLGCSRNIDDPHSDGFTAPIIGVSMAPNIPNVYAPVQCDDCQLAYLVDPNNLPPHQNLVCPNCGATCNVSDKGIISEPCIAEIDTSQTEIERWDIVALEEKGGRALLKRIVGLPGEKIEIKNGDIFANDIRAGKGFNVQTSIAVEVCRPFVLSKNNPRIVCDQKADWQILEREGKVHGALWFLPANLSNNQLKTLKYVHRQNYKTRGYSQDIEPIKDSYGFNQYLSRNLNDVFDIMVRFEQTIGSSLKRWQFKLHDGYSWIDLDWNATNKDLSWKYEQIQQQSERCDLSGEHHIVVSIFDRRLVVRVDTVEVFSRRLPETKHAQQAVAECIQLAADQDVRLKDMRIYRDVYYLPDPVSGQTVWTLGEDEFFVLGDNVPVSIDSRSKDRGFYKKSQVIGRYKRWVRKSQLHHGQH